MQLKMSTQDSGRQGFLPSSRVARFYHRIRNFVERPSVERRLVKIERALELELIDLKQASVNKVQAEAVSILISSLEHVPNAAHIIGSFLFLKLTDEKGIITIISHPLTQEQLQSLHSNPAMIQSPHKILENLSSNQFQNTSSEK